MCWSNPSEQACRVETDAQASQKIRHCPQRMVTDDFRSTAQRPALSGLKASLGAGDGRTIERRIRTSRSGTRAQDAALQERRLSAEFILSTHAAVFNHLQRLTSAQTHRTLRAAAMNTSREAALAL